MKLLRSRLVYNDGEACLQANGAPASQITSRLERGEGPSAILAASALDPADLIAALAADSLGDDRSLGPTLTQTSSRAPRLLPQLSEPAWAAIFPNAPRTGRLNLAAGLLLVHDFWDASHTAAQEADDLGEREFSAYWHGIAHRREPDAANANYWFRRVGRHPVFESLAEEARPLLEEHGDGQLTSRLVAGGWNAAAMIDVCTQARPGTPRETLARRLQRLEMWLLLEATFAALAAA
ncbi:MAG: hypothetical protein ACLQVF_40300 [Isosphaeraceae bacterium]